MKGEIIKIHDLGEQTTAEMYQLFLQQFECVSFEDFCTDLQQKNWLLLLRLDNGELSGFSSMHVYQPQPGGRQMAIVFSGDTVVDARTWRDSALSYYWMGAVDYLRRKYRMDRMHWFLLVSGYRTYRFLPVYCERFYPRYDQPTPAAVQLLIDSLAHQRFGDRYDAGTGVVRLRVPAILRKEFRGIPEGRLKDPHIALFAKINPGHESGDELVCFSEVAEDNLTRIGRRMWRRGGKLFPDDHDV